MKRIGILTLYGYYNFGNRFQNYAVGQVLKKYGYSAETIVVYPNVKPLLRPALNSVKAALGSISAKRYMKIYRFSRKYIPVRTFVRRDLVVPDSISLDYAFFVTGSDQVWNPEIRPSERQNYFLSFAKKEQRICISPSFGTDEIGDEYRDLYINGLNGFNLLSSREQSGTQIIKRLTGRDAELLIDPTLALTKDEWETVFSEKSEVQSDYLLLAMLGKLSEDRKEYVNALAKKHNLQIVDVFEQGRAYGPDEVLRLIAEAKLVFTDSFHFTAFSVNFHTPFIVAQRQEDSVNSAMFSRLDSLLGMFSLQERKFGSTPTDTELSCDFGYADSVLASQRDKFYNYVERSLNYKNEG